MGTEQKASEISGNVERISAYNHGEEQLFKLAHQENVRQSIIITEKSEACPFKGPNRSPDSFVRVSTHGNDGAAHYARVSLVS